MQCRHFLWEWILPTPVIHIDGDLHLNCRYLDFRAHNLGDDLNLPLLKELTGCRIVPRRYTLLRKKPRRTFLVIGSILEACMHPEAVVWGAGLIQPPSKKLPVPRRISAVRGPLTRSKLLKQNIKCPETYGDPALLLPLVYQPPSVKRHPVCLIPHVSELDCAFVQSWQSQGRACLDLRNYRHWQECIDFIAASETVLSSSLHGLILADSYGVPSRRIVISDRLIGGDFKFHDYYLSFCELSPAPLLPEKRSLREWQSLIQRSWQGSPGHLARGLLASCPLPLLKPYMC